MLIIYTDRIVFMCVLAGSEYIFGMNVLQYNCCLVFHFHTIQKEDWNRGKDVWLWYTGTNIENSSIWHVYLLESFCIIIPSRHAQFNLVSCLPKQHSTNIVLINMFLFKLQQTPIYHYNWNIFGNIFALVALQHFG